MVLLLVGQDEAPFNVHRDILCKASPFFTSAFMGSGAGEFQEKSKQSMNLPEEDPEIFDNLIQWIYAKRFPFYIRDHAESSYVMATVMHLAILYAAADKYDILELKNDVIHQLWILSDKTTRDVEIVDKIIEVVYANTVAGSRFRKLLVQWQANSAGSNSFAQKNMKKLVRDYPEYAADLLAQISKRYPAPSRGEYIAIREAKGFEENSEIDDGTSEDDDGEGSEDEDSL